MAILAKIASLAAALTFTAAVMAVSATTASADTPGQVPAAPPSRVSATAPAPTPVSTQEECGPDQDLRGSTCVDKPKQSDGQSLCLNGMEGPGPDDVADSGCYVPTRGKQPKCPPGQVPTGGGCIGKPPPAQCPPGQVPGPEAASVSRRW
jgi:hypothetical protein